MPRQLVIVPRWAGTPASDFYPWLLATLREEQPPRFGQARALALPRPEQPEVSTWVPAVAEALEGLDAGNTVLLAHSVGCQALLRGLARQPPGRVFAGVLMVAGWWSVDAPWPSLLPWQEPVAELERARAAARRFHLLLSDNDPYTADFQGNAALWRARLGAEVDVIPGAKHFNAPREPAVLEALRRLSQ